MGRGTNKGISILRRMILPMGLIVLVQALLCGLLIYGGGLSTQLDENAFSVLSERISNRKTYLQNEMIQRWSNVSFYADYICLNIEQVLDGKSFSEVRADQAVTEEMVRVSMDPLVDMLRRNSVTGAFLVLDTDEPSAEEDVVLKQGLYIRDLNPMATPQDSSDLLLERAPATLAQEWKMPADTPWRPLFIWHAGESELSRAFYEKPLEAAKENPGMSVTDLGYWNPPAKLYGDEREVITYSVPLIGNQGEIYGVLGIEVSVDYFKKLLPYDEIAPEKRGAYALALGDTDDPHKYTVLVETGALYEQEYGIGEIITLKEPAMDGHCHEIKSISSRTIYGCVQEFQLYDSNTPFAQQRWALIGLQSKDSLLQLSAQVRLAVITALVVSMLLAVAAIIWSARRFARPVEELARQVSRSGSTAKVRLKRINIQEIDELAAAIESLSRNVAKSASRLSKIVAMTSMSIGAFEYHADSEKVYYTDKLFSILHLSGPTGDGFMPEEPFKKLMLPLAHCVVEEKEGMRLFRFITNKGEHWVRMQLRSDSGNVLAVAQDVTSEMLEKQKIEHERDYDLLTNLQNRRAFLSGMDRLFQEPERLGCAAVVMFDLDNLKAVNDNFGHDVGDRYICAAADALRAAVPTSALLSRFAGDEFYLLLWGYHNREEIREVLCQIKQKMRETKLKLSYSEIKTKFSAGVAWYPDDSTEPDVLMRYADFAMYQIKHAGKGEIREFERGAYEQNVVLLQKKQDFNRLIEEKMLYYHFQPIVDTCTGEIFGYEALLRSQIENLGSPLEILALADTPKKLHILEQMTFFGALQAFQKFGAHKRGRRLFVNSIPNVMLTDEEWQQLKEQYEEDLKGMVLELTETQKWDRALVDVKLKRLREIGGELALDDFGSGYSSETALLDMAPNFIKVDQSIVQGVDRDNNRQKILKNMVSYGKSLGIRIVAEGVEKESELRALLELGVDYVQGYYLGKPELNLLEVRDEARRIIMEFNAGMESE